MPTRENVRTPARTRSGDPTAFCLQCGSQEFRIRRRSVLHRLFSVVVYECGRCDYRQTGFRFSFVSVVAPLILAGVAWAALYISGTRPWLRGDDSPGATADALARARNSSGALSTFELMMLRKPRTTMDNASVLKLWKANVGTNVITQMIRNSNADYDLSPAAVIQLKEAGVDQTIILAMMDVTYNVR